METYDVIAAIDFGTSNIGFAYSFPVHEDEIHFATQLGSDVGIRQDDVDKIAEDVHIQQDEISLVSSNLSKLSRNRVPPILLMNADGKFNAFGKQAVDRFAQLVVTKRHQGFRYYDTFKKELYRITQTKFEIPDKQARKMPALKLFSLIIRHVGKLALQSMREQASSKDSQVNINPKSVLWVLTVPAIWSDLAIQLMREAAIEAGIPRDKLRLVREPEAAAFFWRAEMKKSSDPTNQSKIAVGSKYIVADIGGGFVDICAHEILPYDRIRELFLATGNDIGGNHVDEMFIEFLKKSIGEEVWQAFCRQHYFDFIKLMRKFEQLKRAFDGESGSLVIELPISLIKMVEQSDRGTIEDIIKSSEAAEYVHIEAHSCLHIKNEYIETFFKPSVTGIVTQIKNVLRECQTNKITTLLLAGGYSSSPYVQGSIKREFSSMAVTMIPDGDLAVLKGAVLMGYAPEDLIERRARYSYGFAVARPFEENRHPLKFRFVRDGKLLCRDVFYKVIDKNQLLKVGDRFILESRNNDRKYCQFRKRGACAQLFCSSEENPSFCTHDDKCVELFTTLIEAPSSGWSDRLCIDYALVVKDSCFEVEAFDIFTGRKYETRTEMM